MAHLGTSQSVLWGICLLAQLMLLLLLFRQRTFASVPSFTAYILVCIGQSAVLLPIYLASGFSSPTSRRVAWVSQAVVILVRGIAVAELCRRILRAYRGIWELGWRLLLTCASIILVYAFYAASRGPDLVVLAADRGSELAIASVIVLLLLFARYYRVPVPDTERLLVVGFCLYSCTYVLNNSLERLFYSNATWNLVQSVALLSSLILWIWALRLPMPQQELLPRFVPVATYNELSPQINFRLRKLNEQLLALWKSEAPTA